ncbi:MAG: hypothetical protein EPO68_04035 [Planctomycetota bacterium]|nr:MAG: hypothetical protein EPO68_04035 [Planctomycetota bacterium]
MLDFLRAPVCPVPARVQAWQELRMTQLVRRLGVERVLRAPVATPTRDCFPELFERGGCDVDVLLRRTAALLGVDASGIALEVVPDDALTEAAGSYSLPASGPLIRVPASHIARPERLVATLFHELSHHLLIVEAGFPHDDPEHEFLTDLVPALLGAGLFAANTAESTTHEPFDPRRWTVARQGYWSVPAHAHALALFASFRGEKRPRWRKHMRRDVRVAFDASSRHLRRVPGCRFDPRHVTGAPRHEPDSSVLVELSSVRPASVLLALWELDAERWHPRHEPALLALLEHADPSVAAEALAVAVRRAVARERVVAVLSDRASSRDPLLRAAAIRAFAQLSPLPIAAPHAFHAALADVDDDVRAAACEAIAETAASSGALRERLATLVGRAHLDCDDEDTAMYLSALASIAPDARALLREHAPEVDWSAAEALLRRAESGTEG